MREHVRKSVHVAMGFLALSFRWLTPLEAAALGVALVVHNVVAVPRYARFLWLEADERRGVAVGIVAYPVVVLGLVVLFRENLPLAAAGWAILAFGDGFAGLAGRLLGGPPIPWNPAKSLAGTSAFVVFGLLGSALVTVFVAGGSPGRPVGLDVLAGATLAAAFAESLAAPTDDNLRIGLAVALVLGVVAAGAPERIGAAAPVLAERAIPAGLVGGALGLLAGAVGAASRAGALAGALLAAVTAGIAGLPMLATLVAFVAIGSVATRIGRATKEARRIAEPGRGRRRAGQAFANAGIGVYLAVLGPFTGAPELFALAATGALAAAAFDTVASEIGPLLGRAPVLPIAWRRVEPGTAGAISFEGTIAGLLAAVLVGAVAVATGAVMRSALPAVGIAALLASTLESAAGATLGRAGFLGHDARNVLNTIAGAGGAVAFAGHGMG